MYLYSYDGRNTFLPERAAGGREPKEELLSIESEIKTPSLDSALGETQTESSAYFSSS